MKLFFGILLVFTTSMIGYKLTERKRFVKNFFDRLKVFNTEESIDIGLFSNTVGEKLLKFNNDVDGAIDGYEAIFDGKPFLCRDKRLDKSEREFVSFYVNSLGRYDAVGQTEFHSSAEKKIDVFLSTASETAKRYSALSVKLAFCLGVSLFILFI